METMANEIMTNEVVAEATEDIVTVVSSDKSFMKKLVRISGTAIVVGGVILVVDNFIVKPLKAKIKAKKELDEVIDDVKKACITEDVEDFDDVTDINEEE